VAQFQINPVPQEFKWTLQWKNWLNNLWEQLTSFSAAPEFPTLTTGGLVVTGDALIEGSLEIEEDLSAADAAFAGEVTIGEELTVGEDLRVEGESFGSAGINIQPIQDTTSGTSKEFPIPSWAKRITVPLISTSTNGTSEIRLRVGHASGMQATGYLGTVTNMAGSTSANFTAGFDGIAAAAAAVRHGSFVLTRCNIEGTIWSGEINIGRSDTAAMERGWGTVTLDAALDRVQLTTVGGVNTFDLGSVGCIVE
jgi:hypothetical protein